MDKEASVADLLARALQTARACLDAGEFADAEQLCRAVLANAPDQIGRAHV